MPVLQLVMGQVQLVDMSTESHDPRLVPCLADAPAIQHQHTGQVHTVWRGGGGGWGEE